MSHKAFQFVIVASMFAFIGCKGFDTARSPVPGQQLFVNTTTAQQGTKQQSADVINVAAVLRSDESNGGDRANYSTQAWASSEWSR